jgi:CRISPR system Cascade subunit CasA
MIRPSVLDQIGELGLDRDVLAYPFRCIGMRTDMKAKIFEWVDATFEVPAGMLENPLAWIEVQGSVDFARDCAGVIGSVFRQFFGGQHKKSERNTGMRSRMLDNYWGSLADDFRQHVLDLSAQPPHPDASKTWAELVVRRAQSSFRAALRQTGDSGAALLHCASAEQKCTALLFYKRKQFLGE